MIIKIETELTGRELFLIKSILNIKDNYGNNRFILTDNKADCDVHIDEQDNSYRALVLKDNQVFQFVPTINPNSISRILTEISQYFEGYDTDSTHLIDHIVELVQSDSKRSLYISNGKHRACLSTKNGLLHTDFKTDIDALTAFISDESSQVIKQESGNKPFDLPYEYPLFVTLWKVGLLYQHSIYDKHFHNDAFRLKLEQWPNYGRLSFQPEYIYLTAALKNQTMTLAQLSDINKADEKTIYSYLNAMILTGHIKVLKTNERPSVTETTRKPVSTFLHGLKTLFSRS